MQSINGFHFEDEFCHFINHELLAETGSKNAFWDQFTNLLQVTHAAVSQPSGTRSSDVSLLNPRYALKAINARWGSLYAALYHENRIPQTAGLKTGQRFNVARASRVISYSREFLDATFPLSEGSHKDAVSYLVYFQNLMVTLADGSVVGLQNPAQFVAKSGPKDDPEAIVLRNADIHMEIRFDRNGNVGATDMANIDDIFIEAPSRTILGCEAHSVADKCEVLRNLLALSRGDLSVKFNRDGKTRTRRLNRNNEFTARNGDTYIAECCNPVVLQLHAGTTCPAVSDANDNPLPAAVVDAALFSLLACTSQPNRLTLMAASNEAYELIKPVIDRVLSDDFSQNIELLKNHQAQTKEPAQTADNHARPMPWAQISEEELKNTAVIATQNTAVLNAIHRG